MVHALSIISFEVLTNQNKCGNIYISIIYSNVVMLTTARARKFVGKSRVRKLLSYNQINCGIIMSWSILSIMATRRMTKSDTHGKDVGIINTK